MKMNTYSLLISATLLVGCSLIPPAPEKLANLPVITYPAKPAADEFIYKFPAGKPIDLQLIVDGSALTQGVKQTVSASLQHDLYLYQDWASEDGQHWEIANKLIDGNLNVELPTYERPNHAEIHLRLNNKAHTNP